MTKMHDTYDYAEVPIPFLGRRYMDAVFGDEPFPRQPDPINKYIRAHRMGIPPEELDPSWVRPAIARPATNHVANPRAKAAPSEQPSTSSPHLSRWVERVGGLPDPMGSKLVASLAGVTVRHLRRLRNKGLIHATRRVPSGSSRLRLAKAEVVRFLTEMDGE